MKTLTKIAAFVVAVIVVFFLAFALGTAVGPIELEQPATTHSEEHK